MKKGNPKMFVFRYNIQTMNIYANSYFYKYD